MTLQIDLQEWANANVPDDEMRWKKSWWAQIMFVRDKLAGLFARTHDEYLSLVKVVSTHTSKSCRCPVYFIELEDLGLKVWLRYNFYDWNVSIEATCALPRAEDFLGIVDGDGGYSYCFCQGMAAQKFESIGRDPTRFTACVVDDYDLYTMMRVLRKHFGITRQRP